jgi:hypothetical protein
MAKDDGLLVALLAMCMCASCLCCMSSVSSVLANNCTKGTLDGDDFDSDACFTFPGPSPSPSPSAQDDTFPKDIKGLTGRYTADSYSGGVWKDLSDKSNDVDVDGTLTREGKGLVGTGETSMRFPKDCMGEDKAYTLAYVGKYHGDKRGRIFDGSDVNWLSGWHGNKSGVAYHGTGEWISGDPKNISGQALLMGVDQKNLFRLNGVDKTKPGYSGGEAPTQITINDGMAKAGGWGGDGEVSDFLLCEVLIYERELTTAEMKQIEEYLQTTYFPKLPTGTITAKGFEKVSTVKNEEPWYKYSGNQEHCRLAAKKLGYKVWGHRNESHAQEHMKNTCFFYPDDFSATYTDDGDDDVHTMGCADATKDPHNGC